MTIQPQTLEIVDVKRLKDYYYVPSQSSNCVKGRIDIWACNEFQVVQIYDRLDLKEIFLKWIKVYVDRQYSYNLSFQTQLLLY